MKMLTEYMRAAMRQAQYEILEDGSFYREIPNFHGVYANADALEACREELREVLEGWLVIPNPHKGDISGPLLVKIFQQAGISQAEWEDA
jgi:predicted RNase H-like HicB family nuclease